MIQKIPDIKMGDLVKAIYQKEHNVDFRCICYGEW